MRKWILVLLWLPTLVLAAPPTTAEQVAKPAAQATGEKAAEGKAASGDNDTAKNDQSDDGWGPATTAFDRADQQDADRFQEQDPWEGLNRKVFGFNDFVDRWALKPVAKGYRWITPRWLNDTITRVFQNLHDLSSGVNSVLQWRWGDAGDDFGRFAVNSTLGVAGLFDVASKLDIEKHSTSLDLTLARWGVHAGPYMVLPLLGPSSVRDTGTLYPSAYLWAPTYINDSKTRLGVVLLYGIDTRADLLDLEKNIIGDRYTFIRNAYLQKHVFDRDDDQPPPLPDDNQSIKSDDGW